MAEYSRYWDHQYDATVPKEFTVPQTPIKEFFKRNVMDFPDRTYLIVNDLELSYSTVNYMACSLANYFTSLGIVKGDRVALMYPNVPQYVVAFHACMKLGVIAVPTNPLYTKPEIQHQFEDAGVKAVCAFAMFAGKVIEMHNDGEYKFVKILTSQIAGNELPLPDCDAQIDFNEAIALINDPSEPATEVAPEDIAFLQYTGGTTGVPKGCCLTNANIVTMGLMLSTQAANGCKLNQLRSLASIPLYHIFGENTNININLFAGGTIILVPIPSPENVLTAIKKHRPTFWAAVPAMIIAINNTPDAREWGVDSIDLIICGSSPLPVEQMRQFEEISQSRIIEGYGMSETVNILTANLLNKRKPGTVGIPYPGVDMMVVDLETGTRQMGIGEEGELIAKGPQIMKEYWQKPEETAKVMKDGWIHTGDIATMDEEGFVTIVDRKKDMILSSGFNVYPNEVDDVLYSHPKVMEACCIGVPDEKRGESLKAFIVLKEGVTAEAEEFSAFCRERLAPYKVPKYIEFTQEIPRTFVGKPDRKALKEMEMAKQ